jgi:hypothetical protein
MGPGGGQGGVWVLGGVALWHPARTATSISHVASGGGASPKLAHEDGVAEALSGSRPPRALLGPLV